MSLKITDNSVLPFVFLVAMIYSIFYIFFNSLFDSGTPFMPHNKSSFTTGAENRSVASSIDPLGSRNFIIKDDTISVANNLQVTTTSTPIISNSGWLNLKRGMSPEEVIALVGEPSSKEKGITEIWSYKTENNRNGMALFYNNQLVNFNIPGMSSRRLN